MTSTLTQEPIQCLVEVLRCTTDLPKWT